MKVHEFAIRRFLKAHPEHIQGVTRHEIDGKEELCIDTDTLLAFCDWCVKFGVGNKKKAIAFREFVASGEFRKQLEDQQP